MKKIRKAILPVAGKGTRMMPLTMHQPKGMIALADKPMIHYVIDEMLKSGIEEVVIVLGKNQEVFRDYLDYLSREGIWNHIKFRFVYQKEPLGDGDAIYSARKFIKNGEPFVVAFSDDIFCPKNLPLPQMISKFKNIPMLLLEKVPMEQVIRSGVVKAGLIERNIYSITGVVEKPKAEDAPSNLIIIGRYVLPYKIFDYIKKQYPFTEKEIRIAYALESYLKDNKKVSGIRANMTRFDCGSKEGLVRAQAYFAMNHPQFKNGPAKLI